MPMRKPLLPCNSLPDNSNAFVNLGQAILPPLASPDFIAIVAFSGAGIATSLKLVLTYPGVMEAVALFVQTG